MARRQTKTSADKIIQKGRGARSDRVLRTTLREMEAIMQNARPRTGILHLLRTDASDGDECRPSPVNVFGHVDGDPRVFKSVPLGTHIRLALAEAGGPVAARAAPEAGGARRSGR